MNTVTYQSQNAPAGQEWLAQVFLPNGQKWLVHSYGATETEAVMRITALYESEISKAPVNCDNKVADKPAPVKTGRGSHFVGKVWLIHSFTRAKIRVDQSEVEKYLTEGWIKGGPRSK